MMNSPTMCQYYVAKALEPMRKQFPNFLLIHYMGDILFSAPSILETQQMLDIAQQYLKDSGLIIAPEKIQTSTPYHYLGFIVNRQHITPQLTQIHVGKLSTLNDFQKLLVKNVITNSQLIKRKTHLQLYIIFFLLTFIAKIPERM